MNLDLRNLGVENIKLWTERREVTVMIKSSQEKQESLGSPWLEQCVLLQSPFLQGLCVLVIKPTGHLDAALDLSDLAIQQSGICSPDLVLQTPWVPRRPKKSGADFWKSNFHKPGGRNFNMSQPQWEAGCQQVDNEY